MSESVDLRILQANERTLLAWIRTGLTLMAFGFVIDRLALYFKYEIHTEESGSIVIGSVVIGVGAMCQVVGAIRFIAMRRALLAGHPAVPGVKGPIVLSMVVASLGILLLVYFVVS